MSPTTYSYPIRKHRSFHLTQSIPCTVPRLKNRFARRKADLLRHLLSKNPSLRLAIDPLLWSAEQLEILNCQPVQGIESTCSCWVVLAPLGISISLEDYDIAGDIHTSLNIFSRPWSTDRGIELMKFLTKSLQIPNPSGSGPSTPAFSLSNR
jgi:hypothetical protein